MSEELNNQEQTLNKETIEGGSEEEKDLNQVVLDLQSEVMEKDSLIDELKQQILALDEIKSDKLFKEVEPKKLSADELREKIGLLSQKIQEYIYFAGKGTLASPAGDQIKYANTNQEKFAKAQQEVNSLLRELGETKL